MHKADALSVASPVAQRLGGKSEDEFGQALLESSLKGAPVSGFPLRPPRSSHAPMQPGLDRDAQRPAREHSSPGAVAQSGTPAWAPIAQAGKRPHPSRRAIKGLAVVARLLWSFGSVARWVRSPHID